VRVARHVDADAVPKQCPTGAPLRGVHREDGNGLFREVSQEAPDQLVGEGGLPGAARSGDAHNRDGACGEVRPQGLQELRRLFGVLLDQRDGLGNGEVIALEHEAEEVAVVGNRGQEVAALEYVVDHALQPHGAPVIGVVDAGNAVAVELLDFGGEDCPTASAEDLDVPHAALLQQVVHVGEELHVPALVAGHGDALGVLLDGAFDNLLCRAVVPQVNDFGAGGLHDAPHDVDGGVVPIKQRCCRDNANPMLGTVRRGHRCHGMPVVQSLHGLMDERSSFFVAKTA
jgi:hypothetical protein